MSTHLIPALLFAQNIAWRPTSPARRHVGELLPSELDDDELFQAGSEDEVERVVESVRVETDLLFGAVDAYAARAADPTE